VTTREGNELAVWFGTQVYNAATCDPSLISVPAAFVTVPGGDCLSGSNEGLAFESAYRQLGAPATSSGWAGSSLLATTNIAQVVTLRPSSLVQRRRLRIDKSWSDGQDPGVTLWTMELEL